MGNPEEPNRGLQKAAPVESESWGRNTMGIGMQNAQDFVERYLYRARGFRALEESVLAQGERLGHSTRQLRRAGRRLNVMMNAGVWELAPERAHALTQAELLELDCLAGELPVRVPQPARR